MASTMVSVGSPVQAVQRAGSDAKNRLFASVNRLSDWLERSDYRAYDTFDGLNAKHLRPLTFENKFLRQVLLQGVRRFPLNLRPLLGITKERSSKGMGFIVRGYIRLHQATGNTSWAEKARTVLQWLVENRIQGYSGACWGNHFDYQSRTSFVMAGVPSVVWTSLIGHVFLDAYEHFEEGAYLEVAASACDHILNDLKHFQDGEALCISYFPGQDIQVHNANALGASLLARTYRFTRNHSYRDLATRAMLYTAQYQRADGSWYYGQKENLRWVDNFHTAYVLDCLKHYSEGTGDTRFDAILVKGYEYWKATFFLADGTARYYHNKTLPLDIQCCSQAIDTLVFFRHHDPESLELAVKVAEWAIRHMQDPTGYFYYRRYSHWLVNKTPTLHWGQATMMSALASIVSVL
jgi:hypothetical protein